MGKKKEYVLQNKVVAQRGSHTCWYGNKRHSEEGGRGFEQWVTLGVSVSCISLYKPRPHWLFITWFHSIWNVSDSRELIVNDCVQKTLKIWRTYDKAVKLIKNILDCPISYEQTASLTNMIQKTFLEHNQYLPITVTLQLNSLRGGMLLSLNNFHQHSIALGYTRWTLISTCHGNAHRTLLLLLSLSSDQITNGNIYCHGCYNWHWHSHHWIYGLLNNF